MPPHCSSCLERFRSSFLFRRGIAWFRSAFRQNNFYSVIKTRKTLYTCHWRQCSGSQLAERLHCQGWLLVRVRHKYFFISLLPMAKPDGGVLPPIVNHCTAFNSRYTMFFYFLSLKNKIIVFIPTPANSN